MTSHEEKSQSKETPRNDKHDGVNTEDLKTVINMLYMLKDVREHTKWETEIDMEKEPIEYQEAISQIKTHWVGLTVIKHCRKKSMELNAAIETI